MESERSASNASSRLRIDLNEVPISSPGEAQEEVAVPLAAAEASVSGISVCAVCGIPVERPVGIATEQPQQEWRCFHCLLKNGGSEGGGDGAAVGGGGGPIDINASPPREAETQRERNLVDLTADVAVLVSRDPQGDRGASSKLVEMEKKTPSTWWILHTHPKLTRHWKARELVPHCMIWT